MTARTQRFFSQTFSDAYAAGIADTVIEILTTRGIQLTDEQRDQIRSTTDEDQLTGWVRAAITASTADEVLRR